MLLPVYNGKDFLYQSIKSVINQSYENIELLIVDDASTDESLELLHSFNDNRIRLIQNKKNIGQTATLNKGIDLCKGEYIARIDQDDYFHREKLSKQVQALKKSNAKVIGSWSYGITNNEVTAEIKHPITNNEIIKSIFIRQPFVHSSLLFDKKTLLKVNKYPKNFRLAMDYSLIINLAISGVRFLNVREFLTYLRFHESSSSKRKLFEMEQETYYAFKSTIKMVNKENIDIYRSMQFYRLIKLLKFAINNFTYVLKIFKKELRLINIYYFLKVIFLHILFKNYLVFPVIISKRKNW